MNLPTDDDARFAREQLAGGCDRMEQLLRGLLDTKGRIAEEVHATRKLGKSLRGGFLLFRLGANSSLEIQAIGRLLSGPRDAVPGVGSRNGTLRQIKITGAKRPAPLGDGTRRRGGERGS